MEYTSEWSVNIVQKRGIQITQYDQQKDSPATVLTINHTDCTAPHLRTLSNNGDPASCSCNMTRTWTWTESENRIPHTISTYFNILSSRLDMFLILVSYYCSITLFITDT